MSVAVQRPAAALGKTFRQTRHRCRLRTKLNFRKGLFMIVLFIILGILMISCGFSCIFTPLYTFWTMGYFVMILATVYGVFGIVRAIRYRRFGLNFVFSIISVLFGICVLLLPNLMVLTDTIMLYMSAAWMVLMGIVNIYTAAAVTRHVSKIWILQLIFGILAVILGIFAFFYPLIMANAFGIMIGIFFIETGFTMIFAGAANE